MERAGNEDMSDDVERKGLGTPATRADIIEKLVKDGFVKREKKQIIPTEDGMKLIKNVELEGLINCILEKGIEEHGFYE